MIKINLIEMCRTHPTKPRYCHDAGHDTNIVGRRKDGRCKSCKGQAEKKWAENNADKVREKNKRLHQEMMADPEKKEKRNAAHRAHHRANRDAENLKNKIWRNNNQDQCRATHHNNRPGVTDFITAEDVKSVRLAANNKCYYCPRLNPEHLEHKIPICRGGRNIRENLCISCSRCNWLKWTKTEEEFKKWRELGRKLEQQRLSELQS